LKWRKRFSRQTIDVINVVANDLILILHQNWSLGFRRRWVGETTRARAWHDLGLAHAGGARALALQPDFPSARKLLEQLGE
jgi:hypothetical protein